MTRNLRFDDLNFDVRELIVSKSKLFYIKSLYNLKNNFFYLNFKKSNYFFVLSTF